MTIFWIIFFILFIVGIFATIKTELPKRLKKEREIWEEEKNKKLINNDEKKRIFEDNRKKRTREMHQNNARKGKEYESFVAEHFKNLGYKVKEHGLIHGRKDSSIDVITMKDKEITFIQCKNWREDSKHKITHEKIKAFIGDTEEFLRKEENIDKAVGYTIKRLYVTSNDVLDNSARYFLKDSSLVEHMIIPMGA
ncbi:MAG: restriction endonuclease [Sulfurimonas sp.]|uniref:restriction endonuclease n=1 Tax=Sulfurimonas sp. TaxID=2022749 RepID=UPI0026322A4C|nr:restriction endonuclease [Sulfurimonas sp.]MDD5400150.1 restriction endonuclease [Sulfurimonas sp.]